MGSGSGTDAVMSGDGKKSVVICVLRVIRVPAFTPTFAA